MKFFTRNLHHLKWLNNYFYLKYVLYIYIKWKGKLFFNQNRNFGTCPKNILPVFTIYYIMYIIYIKVIGHKTNKNKIYHIKN